MSDRDASLDEASNIAFKALKEKPPAKPVDLYFKIIIKFCNTLRFSKVLLIDRGIILLFIAINLFKLIIILSNICII